jgi:hypothetical protein
MRVAPPVHALSCGVGIWRRLQQALFALSVAVTVIWRTEVGLGPIGVWLGFGAGLVAALVAGFWLSPRPRLLSWDGSAWRLQGSQGNHQVGQVTLMFDLGGWLLVRFVPVPRPSARMASWLPFRQIDVGGAWGALRVALYACTPGVPSADGPRLPPTAA